MLYTSVVFGAAMSDVAWTGAAGGDVSIFVALAVLFYLFAAALLWWLLRRERERDAAGYGPSMSLKTHLFLVVSFSIGAVVMRRLYLHL